MISDLYDPVSALSECVQILPRKQVDTLRECLNPMG